ncbi:indolepyruvate oxidoreductase subunit beta [Peptoniphilus sp. KCTC 25270]|uniref:indolepyruvate oxidoreductase subunit beta n=1 Tax=Peptoniphilus sp. KCTC 25270 TaxID=2897414 RepID=UPI001E5E2D6F|nr:indolepyruvate oxidoreductase subunit beta [Peptoniphilus sp. KCTC 25270]MCD1147205.1 indolepyruvate oxidoreductase subunit beta [Peptoniphilus sp. KCTC 25270]
MATTNILIMGVGGQGLVLATNIIANAAALAGYDVKTNDVIGMSQRGGMVWGSVRFGEKVHSPNVPVGKGDVLLGMEPLEALRGSRLLKEGATIVMNKKPVYPTPVLLEQAEYPEEDIKALEENFNLIYVDADAEAKESGNIKVANTIQLGILAGVLNIDTKYWLEAIEQFVPSKALEANRNAFKRGYAIAKGNPEPEEKPEKNEHKLM